VTTELLRRNLLKFVCPRLTDEDCDLIISRSAPTLVSEFPNRRIALGTSPTVFVEDLLGEAGDLKSLILAGHVVAVVDLITQSSYFAGQRIPIDLSEIATALIQTGRLERLPSSLCPVVGVLRTSWNRILVRSVGVSRPFECGITKVAATA